MADLENVIRGIELCGYQDGMPQCDSCPYDGKDCWTRLKRDALSLLKAQEPKQAEWSAQPFANNVWRCGGCYSKLNRRRKDNYCWYCGMPVKWDE
jgi:hypothetical protein